MPEEAMKKSLRKGYFHFELNHDYGTDTVGAEAAEIELSEGVVTFKVKLKPVNDDQAYDADRCKEECFKNVEYFSFLDEHIRKGMSSFVKAYKPKILSWRIEINYGKKYSFACEVKLMNPGGVMFLVLRA